MMDVLVAGEIYVDLILSGFDTWPQPGQESFASEFGREIGGGAAITACGLAGLGMNTGLLGVIGAEDSGWMIERLRQRGVDTSLLQVDQTEHTGITVAVSSSEDRSFFTYRGANRRFFEIFQNSVGARHLHLACVPPWDLDLAKLAGTGAVSLDAGWDPPWLKDPRALTWLSKIDIFFPNHAEASLMTGENNPERILQCFQRAGVKRVALKLGRDGAALLWDEAIYFEGPHQIGRASCR